MEERGPAPGALPHSVPVTSVALLHAVWRVAVEEPLLALAVAVTGQGALSQVHFLVCSRGELGSGPGRGTGPVTPGKATGSVQEAAYIRFLLQRQGEAAGGSRQCGGPQRGNPPYPPATVGPTVT